MDSKALEVRLDDIADDVKVIKEILTGNGDPRKGMVLRMDRLEETQKRRDWWIKAAMGTSISAVVGLLIKLFLHH
jgi:uncharacterized protein YqgV (UPF0045/DUF77 family)